MPAGLGVNMLAARGGGDGVLVVEDAGREGDTTGIQSFVEKEP